MNFWRWSLISQNSTQKKSYSNIWDNFLENCVDKSRTYANGDGGFLEIPRPHWQISLPRGIR